MIFSLSPVYKKHDDDKNWQSNQRKTAGIIESARKILLPTVHDIMNIIKNVIQITIIDNRL